MDDRWRVDLEGERADLEQAQRLRSSDFEVRTEGDRYYLVSDLFRGNADEVKRVAASLADGIWATLHFYDDQVGHITAGSVREMTSPTTWNVTLFAVSAASTSRAGVPTISGGTPRPDGFDERARRIELALTHPEVQSAFRDLAEGNWVSLYKAFETIRRAVGGDANLRKWATRAESRRFTQTSNYEQRHAEGVVPKPRDPMTLPEACTFIRNLVESWLKDHHPL